MMDCIVEIAKDKHLDRIYGLILRDNFRATELFKEKGVTVDYASIKKIVKAAIKL